MQQRVPYLNRFKDGRRTRLAEKNQNRRASLPWRTPSLSSGSRRGEAKIDVLFGSAFDEE
jgi:hypothetical protein